MEKQSRRDVSPARVCTQTFATHSHTRIHTLNRPPPSKKKAPSNPCNPTLTLRSTTYQHFRQRSHTHTHAKALLVPRAHTKTRRALVLLHLHLLQLRSALNSLPPPTTYRYSPSLPRRSVNPSYRSFSLSLSLSLRPYPYTHTHSNTCIFPSTKSITTNTQ